MSQKSPDLQRVLSTIANELLVADTWSMRTSAVWRALHLAGLPNEPRKVSGAHTYTVEPSKRFVYVDGWAVPELGGAIYLITTVVPDGRRNTDAAEIVFKRDSERGPLVLRDGKVHLDAGPKASGRKTRVHLNSGSTPEPHVGLRCRFGGVPIEVEAVEPHRVLYHYTMGPYQGETHQADMRQWANSATSYETWAKKNGKHKNSGMAPFGRSNPKTHHVSAKGAPSGAALDYMREVAGASGVEYGRLTANRDTFRELKRAHRAGDSVAAGVAIVAQYLPRANSGMAPFGGPGAPSMFNNMSAALQGNVPRKNRHRRNLGDGPPPPPPPVPNPGSRRASVRKNHHLHPGDRVSMGAFIGTVDQQIPGTYDKYKVQWDNGSLDKVEGHKLRKIRENPSFRDYFTAGKRTAAEVASSAAQGPSELIGDIHKHVGKLHAGLKEVGARAKAAADRVAAERKCDDPTPAEAIKILARAHGVKVNPVGPHGYRRNLGDGPPPPPPLALRANRVRRNLGDGPPPPPPPVPLLRENIGDGSFPAPLDRTPRGHMRRNGFLGDIVRYPGSKKVQGRSVTETSTYAETLLNRGSHDLAQMERLREEVREQRRHYPDNERLASINNKLDLLIAELLYERKRGARANPASSGETGRLVVSVDVPGKGSIRAYDPRPKNQWYNIYVTPANGVEARYALHTGNVIMGYGPYWGSNEKPPAWVLSALRKGGLDWEAV